MEHQLRSNGGQPAKPHIKNYRLVLVGKFAPGQIHVTTLWVTRHKTHRLRIVAMSQGDASIGGTARCGGNTWDNMERNASGYQRFQLLTTAAKDKGISPFEAQHPIPGTGEAHQLVVNRLLWR